MCDSTAAIYTVGNCFDQTQEFLLVRRLVRHKHQVLHQPCLFVDDSKRVIDLVSNTCRKTADRSKSTRMMSLNNRLFTFQFSLPDPVHNSSGNPHICYRSKNHEN